jgi:IS1 family transposase
MLDHSALPIIALLSLVYHWTVIGSLLPMRWAGRLARRTPLLRPPDHRSPAASTDPLPCPACQSQRATASQPLTPSEPPPRIESPRGRLRSVDTSAHFCPNQGCIYYGWIGRGNIRSHGHPNGGQWRQLECTDCGMTFMETTGTIFYRKRVPAETVCRVLTALAEGLNIHATARVFDLDPNTVQHWLRQATGHMDAISYYLIHDLHLSQVQVDELWVLLGQRDPAESGQPPPRATRWVWVGIDPVSKLLLACVVGDRSLTTAQVLIHAIASLLAPGCRPPFLSDQWAPYSAALLTQFGQWVAVPRRFPRGRLPKPRWQPLPGLQYAKVVKQRLQGRVVGVSYRVVYGSLEQVKTRLAASGVGTMINTAFIERVNLSIRQHVAALGRKGLSLTKTDAGLDDQLTLGRGYYNFYLPHPALRVPWPEPQSTRGTGSPRLWQLRTSAMEAGVTTTNHYTGTTYDPHH